MGTVCRCRPRELVDQTRVDQALEQWLPQRIIEVGRRAQATEANQSRRSRATLFIWAMPVARFARQDQVPVNLIPVHRCLLVMTVKMRRQIALRFNADMDVSHGNRRLQNGHAHEGCKQQTRESVNRRSRERMHDEFQPMWKQGKKRPESRGASYH